MTKFHYIYLIWLLPLYFLLMGGYQLMVLRGIDYTYETGESYVADVLEFDIKQIGAQTNGYLVLTFDMGSDGVIQERMSLPLQMAQSLIEHERLAVRYQPASFHDIVILNTYDLQKNLIWLNVYVLILGLLVTGIVAWYASRYASRKIRDGDETLEIERLDPEPV